VSRELIRYMINVIAHRGPDGQRQHLRTKGLLGVDGGPKMKCWSASISKSRRTKTRVLISYACLRPEAALSSSKTHPLLAVYIFKTSALSEYR
jgi:hypothetical protein